MLNNFRFFKIIKSLIHRLIIKHKIKNKRKKRENINIIFGSGNTGQDNWISTEQDNIDLLKIDSFKSFFKINEINKVLAEHVFEHLTLNEGILAIQNIKPFLKKNSKIRIAVPDGNFPDKRYIDYVKPGGDGPGADDHKELYNFKTITNLFDTDFRIELLEFFDNEGNFHYKKWDIKDGMIVRSRYFDPRNNNNQINYSSIILDAIYLG